MGKRVLTWVGLVLGVGGIIAFIYGLTILISNGNCGCSQDGFCGPDCPPADDLGFVGLFAGIWVSIGGFILMGAARARARAQQWRSQFASGTGAFANMSHAGAYGVTGVPDLLRSHGYAVPANAPPGSVVVPLGSQTIVSGGPGFALPGAAPGSAEAVLARDAESGLPGLQPAPGDAAGRLQELDALKQQGVLNADEYAAQRKRILDSI